MKLPAFIGDEVVALVMELLDFLWLRLKLFLEISRNELSPVVFFVLLFLMELEVFLNNTLNVLLPKTLNQVEFVLENDHAKKHFSVLELPFTKLEFSYFTHFFHHWFNLVLQILIESN